ncbi:MAG: CHAT domain-containing protein [Deltaproteobacteria bacterium]|jgi:CHAT domain-containing protein/tetratricopeptide (TPR) repeat protein|nr:CHAT domain-containing protein [Deltaproteobacteria bacterium]
MKRLSLTTGPFAVAWVPSAASTVSTAALALALATFALAAWTLPAAGAPPDGRATRTASPESPETAGASPDGPETAPSPAGTADRDELRRPYLDLVAGLGPDHPDTLRELIVFAEAEAAVADACGLVVDSACVGAWNGRAREDYSRALEILDAVPGPDSPEALAVADALGRVEHRLWDLPAAEGHLGRAAGGRERVLGPDDPDTSRSLSGLAAIFYHKGERESAASLASRALAGLEAALGPDSLDALDAAEVLADALDAMGDAERAAGLYGRVADGREKALSRDSPGSLRARRGQARALAGAGGGAEALDLALRTLAATEAALEPGHPDSARAAAVAAYALMAMDDPEGALGYAERAFHGLMGSLGPRIHPEILDATSALADILAASGDWEAARKYHEMSCYGRYGTLGTSNPHTIHAAADFGGFLAGHGDPDELMGILTDALSAAVRLHGPATPLWALVTAQLGRAYAALGEAEAAVFHLKLAAAAARGLVGPLPAEDPGIRRSWLAAAGQARRELFGVLAGLGRIDEALRLLEPMKEGGPEGSCRGQVESGTGDTVAPGGAKSPGEAGRCPVWGDPAEAGLAGMRDYAGLFDGTPEEAAFRFYSAWAASARAGVPAGTGELNYSESIRDFWKILEDLKLYLAKASSPPASEAERLDARRTALGEAGGVAATVYAVPAERALHLVLVSPDKAVAVESPVGRYELAGMIDAFREGVLDPYADPRPTAKALWDVLFGPLEADLEAAGPGAVLLRLEGELGNVPVAALWDGERWFAERFPAALLLPGALERPAAPDASAPAKARAFLAGARPGFPPFEAAGEGIAEAFAPGPGGPAALAGRTYRGKAFTRKAFLESFRPDVRAVHVEAPLRLSAGRRGMPPSSADSALALGDGGELALDGLPAAGPGGGPEILALAGCGLASGRRAGTGGELEALGEAAARAGAAATLATLWAGDGSARAMIEAEFYRRHYAGGLGKAEALREAEISVMRDGDSPPSPEAAGAASARQDAAGKAPSWEGTGFSHPYYWAQFVLMGDWR